MLTYSIKVYHIELMSLLASAVLAPAAPGAARAGAGARGPTPLQLHADPRGPRPTAAAAPSAAGAPPIRSG